MSNEMKIMKPLIFKQRAALRLIKSRRTGTSHYSLFIAQRPQGHLITHYSLRHSRAAAFSLVEILVAIFVLSIGLIMIAGVFPVAVKWTADDAQTSIAQVIAKNAVATIETQYASPSGTFPVAALNLTATPPNYTGYGPFCYNFGNSSPYPNANPAPAAPGSIPPGVYYWSALILPASSGYAGITPGPQTSNLYTIYVFVFNKGDINNTFTAGGPGALAMQPIAQSSGTPIATYYPQLYSGTLSSVIGGALPVGAQGLDISTGTIFRAIVDVSGNYSITSVPTSTTSPNPNYTAIEGNTVIYAPPAIGQTASPLIYVYVTTVNL
jgi:type II secretory pathway pseudopilin PulG